MQLQSWPFDTRFLQDTHSQPYYHRIQEVSGQGGIITLFQVSYTFSIPPWNRGTKQTALWDWNNTSFISFVAETPVRGDKQRKWQYIVPAPVTSLK